MVVDVLHAANPVLNITGKIWDAHRFLTLDDTILRRIEYYGLDDHKGHINNDMDDSHIATAKKIMRRLRNRDLYKYCGECIIPSTHAQKGCVVILISDCDVHLIFKP